MKSATGHRRLQTILSSSDIFLQGSTPTYPPPPPPPPYHNYEQNDFIYHICYFLELFVLKIINMQLRPIWSVLIWFVWLNVYIWLLLVERVSSLIQCDRKFLLLVMISRMTMIKSCAYIFYWSSNVDNSRY